MDEVFLGILEGGPWPGEFTFPSDYDAGWPLPKFVKAKSVDVGRYVKYWESSGLPQNKNSARGAKYKWDETSVGYDLA
jgi:hypothetical protein